MRKDKPIDPRALDVAALCRAGAELSGSTPLAALERLAQSLPQPPAGDVAWSAQGSEKPLAGSAPEQWLHLQAQAEVTLQCQRCLQPMTQALQVDRRFRFVPDEDEAAALDEELEDDVLVLPARLNLVALIEDELILALPLVPRHASCPQPLQAPAPGDAAAAEAQRPHPFAKLAQLRGREPQ